MGRTLGQLPTRAEAAAQASRLPGLGEAGVQPSRVTSFPAKVVLSPVRCVSDHNRPGEALELDPFVLTPEEASSVICRQPIVLCTCISSCICSRICMSCHVYLDCLTAVVLAARRCGSLPGAIPWKVNESFAACTGMLDHGRAAKRGARARVP